MMSKQLSWRGSNQALSLFLLLSSTFLVAMESDIPRQKFLDEYTDQLEAAFDRCPFRMKALFEKVSHSEYRKVQQNRAAFFVGEPGTEKTISAKAFAFKLQELFEAEYIDCVDFTSEKRGGAVVGLREKIEETLQLGKKGKIIILDEVQELLDHAEDSHYDTASTGRYITKLMNNSQLDENIFIIATLNNLKTFPNQIKSRMRGRIVKFESLVDPKRKREAFLEKTKARKIQFDDSCTEDFFSEYIDSIEGYSGRDFEALCDLIVDQFIFSKRGTLNEIIVSSKDVLLALQEMKADLDETPYSKFDRDYQQRERHHQDNLSAHQEAMYAHRAQMNYETNRAGARLGVSFAEAMYNEPAPQFIHVMADNGCNVM